MLKLTPTTGLAIGAFAALLLITPPARADQTTETQAVQLFNEGRAAFDKKAYERALSLFESSLQLVQSPNTRLYIGRSLREIGKISTAYTAFVRAAGEAHDAAAAGQARYRTTEDAATNEAKALEPTIPHLVVNVPTTAKNVHVKVDGAEIASATFGLNLNVDPGAHVVQATGSHAKAFEKKVDVAISTSTTVDVVLEPIPVATLRVSLADRPYGYAATLDGTALELAALEAPIETAPGEHTLVITAPGRRAFVWNGTLANEQNEELTAALPVEEVAAAAPGKTFPKWPFFVAGGAAVVGIGAATALGIMAKTTSDDEQSKPVSDRTSGRRDNVNSYSKTADILFITGGVLFVGAGVLGYFTWRDKLFKKKDSTTSARIVPWMGPNGGGLVTGGSF